MPPLSLTDEEKDLLLALAQPIYQRQRTQFLTEVTTAIEEDAARTSAALAWCIAAHSFPRSLGRAKAGR